jgi:Protein of unknown function (DUF3307)
MSDLFILALLGHLVGDYLLQTKQMALVKSVHDWRGTLMCTLHVAIYSVAVCIFLRTLSPTVFLAVAIPHLIIDRYSLANMWLRLIRGRTFESAVKPFDVAFTAIVYTVTDNTMHLLCLWVVIVTLLL